MKQLIIFFILLPLSLFAEQTGNLLTNSTFENGNSNGWTTSGEVQVLNDCCGSNYDLEFGASGSIEQSFDLTSDTITQPMLNNGITLNSSVLIQNGEGGNGGWCNNCGGADTFTIRLQIKDSDNNVLATTTQERTNVTGINGENFTDSVAYTESGSNRGNIFISGTDARGVVGGLGGANVDNVEVTMTYDSVVLSATQTAELNTTFQEIEELIEVMPEIEELIVFEEIFFEVLEQPEIEFEMLEELIIEKIATEEINTGIVNIFFSPIETIETIEISELPALESFEEIPMEEIYNEETEIISTQIESTEETEVGSSVKETTVTSRETINTARREEQTEETSREEVNGTGNGSVSGENENRVSEKSSEETTESSENNAGEQEEEIVVAKSETKESESNNETRKESEQSEESNTTEESTDRETETSNSEQDTNTNNESTSNLVQDISVEKIRQKVEQTVKDVDRQLVITNIIVAKSMKSNVDIDSYAQVNNNLFNNQPIIDGGSYDDIREYVDNRNIYQQSQVIYNDDFSKYQEEIDNTKADTIRAIEHLRKIRGY